MPGGALRPTALYREFAGLDEGKVRLPDETKMLCFRHLLEAHDLSNKMFAVVRYLGRAKGLMLKTGTAVDATFLSAPSSTKNAGGERDPEMHSAQKSGNWYFGMKAHIGVDGESGLAHTVIGTAANGHDTVPVEALLHGEECDVFADAG